jgi:hypothetical protein
VLTSCCILRTALIATFASIGFRKPSSVDDWSVSRVFASHADAASGERSDHIRDEGIKIVAWAALSRLSGQMPILHL